MTLREARQERGWTQDVLAEKSGVDQTTISSLERGAVQSPAWDTVRKLSTALRVKPDTLFPSEGAA